MRSKPKVIIFLAIFAFLLLAAPLSFDYVSMRRLQSKARQLKLGMDKSAVVAILGSPHSVAQGWFGQFVSDQNMTDVVWYYRSCFDWDGYRGVSSYEGRPYIWTRLNPVRSHHDEILTVWFRQGAVIGVTIPWKGEVLSLRTEERRSKSLHQTPDGAGEL